LSVVDINVLLVLAPLRVRQVKAVLNCVVVVLKFGAAKLITGTRNRIPVKLKQLILPYQGCQFRRRWLVWLGAKLPPSLG